MTILNAQEKWKRVLMFFLEVQVSPKRRTGYMYMAQP